MASMDYEVIFDSFLDDITDYDLASLDATNAYGDMSGWLHKSVAEPYVRNMFASCVLDDDTQTLTYELSSPGSDADDMEFVRTALAKWMAYEWLHRQVRSVTNTAHFISGKEVRYYSQRLSELRALQEDAYKEAQRFIQDRGFIDNAYFGDWG